MRSPRVVLGVVGTAAAIAVAALVATACDSSSGDTESRPPPSGAGDAAEDTAVVDATLGDVSDASAPRVDASAVPVVCSVTPCAVDIVAGAESVCARIEDGTVRCWGGNAAGELGRGPDGGSVSALAAPVVGLASVTQLSGAPSEAGDAYCAHRADGTALCWGSNALGVLGRVDDGGATTASSPTPAPVDGLGSCTSVSVGHSVGCATLASGEVACWGTNDAAQIPGRPVVVAGDPPFAATTFGLPGPSVQLAIADRGTVALAANGKVFSWGLRGTALGPSTGVLGREVSLAYAPPGEVDLADVSAVSGSIGRVCAIANGRVQCWGAGPTSGSDSVHPTLVGIGGPVGFVQTLSVGPRTVCATLSDGTAQCWGNNAKGQLGNGNTDLQPLPVAVTGLGGRPVRMATMDAATCALLSTGAVQCWGENTKGQLGIGTADALGHLVPKTVELAP
jgi:alpha-tubulin suppressor-like RCC1 family protein